MTTHPIQAARPSAAPTPDTTDLRRLPNGVLSIFLRFASPQEQSHISVLNGELRTRMSAFATEEKRALTQQMEQINRILPAPLEFQDAIDQWTIANQSATTRLLLARLFGACCALSAHEWQAVKPQLETLPFPRRIILLDSGTILHDVASFREQILGEGDDNSGAMPTAINIDALKQLCGFWLRHYGVYHGVFMSLCALRCARHLPDPFQIADIACFNAIRPYLQAYWNDRADYNTLPLQEKLQITKKVLDICPVRFKIDVVDVVLDWCSDQLEKWIPTYPKAEIFAIAHAVAINVAAHDHGWRLRHFEYLKSCSTSFCSIL